MALKTLCGFTLLSDKEKINLMSSLFPFCVKPISCHISRECMCRYKGVASQGTQLFNATKIKLKISSEMGVVFVFLTHGFFDDGVVVWCIKLTHWV